MELKEILAHSGCDKNAATDAEALQPRNSTRRRTTRGLLVRGRNFREAGVKLVAESGHLRGLERDERALALLYPFIGAMPLQQVHHETLAPYVRASLTVEAD